MAGVSGGPDSVCLLHFLAGLRRELNIRLHAVHVNHMIRGEAADEDQRFTEAFCESLGIPCSVFRYDVPAIAAQKGLTSEEAGREARYEAFFKVLREQGAQKIAIAQNLNDQAETVLMRIIRGTGTDGLSGIGYVRDGVVIRPLLDVTRKEIEEYCMVHGLAFRTDLTNLQPLYARNRIRLELLPLIAENYNENIVRGLGRLAGIAREDSDYINMKVMEIVAEHADIRNAECFASIPCEILRGQHPAVGKRIVARLFHEIGLIQDIEAVHLSSAMKIVIKGNTSKSLDFPGGYFLAISYGMVEFRKRTRPENVGRGLAGEKPGILKSVVAERNEVSVKTDSDFIKCFDCDLIPGSEAGLHVRTRCDGDRFSPLGMSGSKKLKDYFIDEKIPRMERDNIPLVCAGNDIIWVVGYRMSEKYKVGPETKRVLILEYQKPVW